MQMKKVLKNKKTNVIYMYNITDNVSIQLQIQLYISPHLPNHTFVLASPANHHHPASPYNHIHKLSLPMPETWHYAYLFK